MTWRVFLTLASHWRRHAGQFATLLAGLALAVGLWTSVQAINAEARASYDTASAALGGAGAQRYQAADGATIPLATYAALRRAGWAASPVVEGELAVDARTYAVTGIDSLTAPGSGGDLGGGLGGGLGGDGSGGDNGDGALALAFLTAPGVILAAPETASALQGAAGLPRVETSAQVAPGVLLTDIAAAQRLLGMEGRLSAILIDPARQGLVPLSQLVPGLVQADGSGDVARLTNSFHLNLTAFGFLSFAVGLFIVYAAIGLAFEQRRASLRTLRALGAPLRSVILALVAEALLLALTAGLAGVALGYGVASALLPDVAATLRGLYGAELGGALSVRPGWIVSGLAIAVIGALGATAQSVRRAAAMGLLASAQPRAWARASTRRLGLQAGAGAALIAVGLITPNFADGIVAGFILLGGLLLGAALLLAPALSLILAGLQRSVSGAAADWFLADTRQQLPSLALALMALMLALAANLGVGTMVGSFRATFTGWLDQRLAAEVYVTAGDEAQAAQLRVFLEAEADAVLPIWDTERDLLGAPGNIFGVADHATYRDNWPLLTALPGAWDALAAGEGVMVNEQLWRRERLRLGEPFPVPGGPDLQIVAVYSDYGNPKGEIMVGLDLLTGLYPDVSRLRYAVRTQQPDALMAAIRARFELPRAGLVDQQSIKQFSLSVFERTFAVTGALNVLTLGVAAFAMFASLTTLATMRLPQLAPVWALGMTRRTLAQLELARAAALAALTFAAALPTGLALAWALLAVVNVEAFGWRLPVHVFPLDWLRLFGLALLAGLLAAALPARRLALRPPHAFLAVFAQER
jgi:putative ABC transport system permease protein